MVMMRNKIVLLMASIMLTSVLSQCSFFKIPSYMPFVGEKNKQESKEQTSEKKQRYQAERSEEKQKKIKEEEKKQKTKQEVNDGQINKHESQKRHRERHYDTSFLPSEKIPHASEEISIVEIDNGWIVEFFYPEFSTETTSEDTSVDIDMIISEDEDVDERELEEVEKIPFPEEATGIPEEEVKELERWFLQGYGYFNIPVEINRYVEYFIYLFTKTDYRKVFEKWLARYFIYAPLMREILKSEGMPDDLVFVAMAESGFSTRAVSPMYAVGPWQFIKGTAKRYGLKIDYWVDERRDPVKSTYAAIRYLKDLYEMFGDWYLAWAAYNAGERRIQRAIKKAGGRKDYWYLLRRRLIPRETRGYVPKIIAVALITKNLEKFGFSKDKFYSEPLTFDTVKVSSQIDIWTLARMSDSDPKEIAQLNPHMRRVVTPPYPFTLKIPKGKRERFLAKLREFERVKTYFKPLVRYDYSPFMHGSYRKKVLGGYLYVVPEENLKAQELADMFGISIWELRKTNKITGSVIRRGRRVKIPLYVYLRPYTIYRVRRGDSLWKISRKFGVSISMIKRMNGLRRNIIYPGQRLKIPLRKVRTAYRTKAKKTWSKRKWSTKKRYARYVPKKSRRNIRNHNSKFILHTVKKGENLYVIARRYGTSWKKIKKVNGLRSHVIYPGQKLIIPVEGKKKDSKRIRRR